MNAVAVQDLERTYANGTTAVRGISFTVARGEVFGLLGTNGAGKTTTVDVVTGLVKPTRGRVEVTAPGGGPRDLHRIRPRERALTCKAASPAMLAVSVRNG